MDQTLRSQQDWKIARTILINQFLVRGIAALLALVLGVWALTQNGMAAMSLLAGGGWMIANCVAMTWMGVKALEHSQAHPERYAFGFSVAVVGSLACGGWIFWVVRPSPLWLAVGLTTALGVFIYQLVQLKSRVGADAR